MNAHQELISIVVLSVVALFLARQVRLKDELISNLRQEVNKLTEQIRLMRGLDPDHIVATTEKAGDDFDAVEYLDSAKKNAPELNEKLKEVITEKAGEGKEKP